MEIAIRNVPRLCGKIAVCPDVSGSMHSAVTGHRAGATSQVRCVDVAALVAAAFLRQNPDTEVLPFENDVVPVRLNPRDSVMSNAEKLANLPCGGTNCSAPLRLLAETQSAVDLVIFVSDNESWIDTPRHGHFGGSATETMKQWSRVKARNPRARYRYPAVRDGAGGGAKGYPEHRRILRPGVRAGIAVRERRTQRRSLGRCDWRSGSLTIDL